MMAKRPSRRTWLACLIFGLAASPVQAETTNDVSLPDLIQGVQQWAQANLDTNTLASLSQIDTGQVQRFYADLQRRYHGNYVVDLASMRQTAKIILPFLELQEQTRPYAAWLNAQMDYLDVAYEIRIAAPPPSRAPAAAHPPNSTVRSQSVTNPPAVNHSPVNPPVVSVPANPKPVASQPVVSQPAIHQPVVNQPAPFQPPPYQPPQNQPARYQLPYQPPPVQMIANPLPQMERQLWFKEESGRPWPPSAREYVPELKPVFAARNVPPQLVWVAEVESSFDRRAESPAGAAGLFQLMPDTARRFGLSLWPRDQRYQPIPSATASAEYFKYLYDRFQDWRLVMAAYNAGEGTVQKLLNGRRAHSYDEIAMHLPAETQMYVPRVEAVLWERERARLEQLPPPQT
jgi:soluble lytic murein transglycosylase-like protein